MIDSDAPLCLPPQPLQPIARQLPAGTVDTHFHVFSHAAPLAFPRSYTPQILTLDDWLHYADVAGIARGVLVQPSVYGLDNRVLLEALARQHGQLRGVVVIAPDTADDELARLDQFGVRAVRINLRNKSGLGLEAMADLAPRIRRLGWHVQFQVGPEAIPVVADLAQRYEIIAVIDHLAFMPLDRPGNAVSDMQRALDTGRVRVKISAPYRLRDTAAYNGYRGVIGSLAANHAEHMLWASDWPHTELFDRMIDDAFLLNLSLEAVPKPAHDAVFVRNAEKLYWSH